MTSINHVITGKVIRGDGYGQKLGFPTANLNAEIKSMHLREGVYAGKATLEGKVYRAGIVIGPGDKVEAHLIGYSGNAYGKEVTLRTEKFIREFKKFEDEEKLIMQIKEDLKLC